MTAAHLKELLALLLIGEGVVGTLYPREHLGLWRVWPFRGVVDWCAERPELLRLVWAAQAGVGLWPATSQLPRAEPSRRPLTAA